MAKLLKFTRCTFPMTSELHARLILKKENNNKHLVIISNSNSNNNNKHLLCTGAEKGLYSLDLHLDDLSSFT